MSIVQVLADYGYTVREDGGDREQQFPCDLHSDGIDGKPSARVYPDSNSWFCFACSKTRDLIQTCREKEGLDFWPAIQLLEARYKLPALPWEEDAPLTQRVSLTQTIQNNLHSDRTYEEERARVERALLRMTSEREQPLQKILAYWEAYDCVVSKVRSESVSEQLGKSTLLQLLERILEP